MKKKKQPYKLILIIGILFILITIGKNLGFIRIAIEEVEISKEQWKEDIEYLREELPKKHIDLFYNITSDEFNDSIDKIILNAPNIEDSEIKIELLKIFGKIGDSHTNFGYDSYNILPFRLVLLDDGVFIEEIDSEYSELLGMKITKINNIDIEDIMEKISELIPHENIYILKNKLPRYLRDIDILKYYNIVENEIVLEVMDSSNNKIIKKMEVNNLPNNERIKLENKSKYIKNRGDNLWSEEIREDILYIKSTIMLPFYNPIKYNQIKSYYNNGKIENIIIDIRNNSGGTSWDKMPLMKLAREFSKQNKDIILITGEETFSSACRYLNMCLNELDIVTYGSPTGGKPDHYGEVRRFNLPNSKIDISYSTKYFTTGISRDSYYPDIEVKTNIIDYINGEDTVLKKILSDLE